MKFNLKRCTFLIIIASVITFTILKGMEFVGNQGADFNSNFKNYNRILEVFDLKGQKLASFKVALADTDKKRQIGLMNLKKLPEDHGMLFNFFPSKLVTMWMKNTFIPLDIIFIDSDNEIATIQTNTTPHSLDLISSQRQIIMALEINAGLTEKLGLKVGHKVKALNQNK